MRRFLWSYSQPLCPLIKMSDEENDLFFITEEEANERLDKVLANRFAKNGSRTYFQYLIEEGKVLLNGAPVKKRIKPREGDEIEIQFLLTPELTLTPESIPLEILYEDPYLLAINKPAGLVVHPAPGHWNGTFVNALLFHCQSLELGQSLRPGIVHRLDKETSGVLLAAKTLAVQQKLIEMFSNRQIHKEYLAICVGNPGSREIRTLIGRHPVHRKQMAVLIEGGREAITQCKTLAYTGDLSYVNLTLVTGRTHQIRVHMKYLNTPVLGDPLYGNTRVNHKYAAERQQLHARYVKFTHPQTGKAVEIEAPLPYDMEQLIKKIKR